MEILDDKKYTNSQKLDLILKQVTNIEKQLGNIEGELTRIEKYVFHICVNLERMKDCEN